MELVGGHTVLQLTTHLTNRASDTVMLNVQKIVVYLCVQIPPLLLKGVYYLLDCLSLMEPSAMNVHTIHDNLDDFLRLKSPCSLDLSSFFLCKSFLLD